MKILEIPERYYPGIQQLINITEETSKNLIDALKDLPPSANVARLAVAVQLEQQDSPSTGVLRLGVGGMRVRRTRRTNL